MMNDDEVRDLFSAYHDRELSPERTEEVRAALDANPSLQQEYSAFCRMLAGLSSMAAEAEGPVAGVEPSEGGGGAGGGRGPDLLTGVQRRLQRRSGGRFYGDGWSRLAGIFPLELVATLVLIGLVMAYAAMTMVSARQAPPSPPPSLPAR